jgi:3-deoxy-D-manno-octulosonate 8-phosphate phosphatase (KDO 8-P phosphatase)
LPDRRAPPAAARLRRVRLVVLDVDGVLTDGRIWLGPAGEEWKSFHVHDGLALARAAAAGLVVAVVSSRTSGAVARRCAELGLSEVHQGVPDKLTVYEALRARHRCRDEDVLVMGDDLADLPVLGRAGLSAAPADAVPQIRRAVGWVTGRPGGGGAVREVVEAVLRAQGAWPA